MSGSNETILRRGLEEFAENRYDVIQTRLITLCNETVREAVKARGWDERARDMTGNLVNSIVAALFRRGRLVHATYSRDEVPSPISRKMTYPKVYTFKPGASYDGARVVKFKPEIKTSSGTGAQDALRFVQGYKADAKQIFHLVFAYTTEYAKYVEAKRATTGYYWATEHILLNAPNILQ